MRLLRPDRALRADGSIAPAPAMMNKGITLDTIDAYGP